VIDGVVYYGDYYPGRESLDSSFCSSATSTRSWSKNIYDADKILQLLYNECAAAGVAYFLYTNTSSFVQRRVEEIYRIIQVGPSRLLISQVQAIASSTTAC
jgi:hypothetical protein